ncbi:MAG: helix-turn-helix domain-containing protein [Deltaproteobacteria bacterium]|nr:helix-turn-helix domain-containing protein [Deltaproteobacteria bacterium]
MKARDSCSRLALLLRARRLSVTELARRAGVARRAIHAWLSGRALPSLPSAFAVARVLETDVTWLFGDASEDRGNG